MSNYCLLPCYIAVKVLKPPLHVCFWCIPLWNERFGANGAVQPSRSLYLLPSPPQKRVCQQVVSSNCSLFKTPQNADFSLKLMQMFQNRVSDTWKCFSLLDKNIWPLKSLGLHCFQKEKVDRTIILHLLLHCKDWWNLLEGLGDVAGKLLWKIHNQDISWLIKRKILKINKYDVFGCHVKNG